MFSKRKKKTGIYCISWKDVYRNWNKIILNNIVKHKLRQKNKRSANSQHKKRKAHTIKINNRFF